MAAAGQLPVLHAAGLRRRGRPAADGGARPSDVRLLWPAREDRRRRRARMVAHPAHAAGRAAAAQGARTRPRGRARRDRRALRAAWHRRGSADPRGRSPRANTSAPITASTSRWPFPYPGGTTTAEALWMGVPVLGMKGGRFVTHICESVLHAAGMGEWVADGEDAYVAKAIAAVRDRERLATLRAGCARSCSRRRCATRAGSRRISKRRSSACGNAIRTRNTKHERYSRHAAVRAGASPAGVSPKRRRCTTRSSPRSRASRTRCISSGCSRAS